MARPLAATLWTAAIGVPLAYGLLLLLVPPPEQDAWAFPLYGSIVATWVIAGAFVATRRPANHVGWVLLGGGLMIGVALVGQLWAYYSLAVHGGALPGTVAGAMVGVLFFPAFYIAMLIPFVFPDGHLMSWRWGIVTFVILAAAVATLVALLIAPGPLEGMDAVENPIGIAGMEATSQAVADTAGLVVFLAIPMGILATVVRYRRGTPVERKQIQWFGSVVALAFSMFFLATVLPQPFGQLAWIVASLSIGLIPVAIGIAILRYRLYEIDRIVSRTIAWASITAVLAGVFVLTNLGLQAVVANVTGAGTIAVAVSTLLVAALFQPLRRRVQAGVDRRFNRARVDAQDAIDSFGLRVRDDVDLDDLRSRLLATARASVDPAAASVWIRR